MLNEISLEMDLENAEEPEIKLPTSFGSSQKAGEFQKTFISGQENSAVGTHHTSLFITKQDYLTFPPLLVLHTQGKTFHSCLTTRS